MKKKYQGEGECTTWSTRREREGLFDLSIWRPSVPLGGEHTLLRFLSSMSLCDGNEALTIHDPKSLKKGSRGEDGFRTLGCSACLELVIAGDRYVRSTRETSTIGRLPIAATCRGQDSPLRTSPEGAQFRRVDRFVILGVQIQLPKTNSEVTDGGGNRFVI